MEFRRILHYCWIWSSLWTFFISQVLFLLPVDCKTRIFTREDLQPAMEIFSQKGVKSYDQLLFDPIRYQLIVGSRDYLFRLSLEGLKKLEEAYWPASEDNVVSCKMKGRSEDECKNYIKILISHGGKLFSCGTSAFKPECSWREIASVKTATEWVDGEAKCPISPYINSTALITSKGDYYIASIFDFSGHYAAIYRFMSKGRILKTVQFDPKYLNEPSFIAAYEIDDFVYFFFRETAVENINCGKVAYSRVARVCKNDKGGQYVLKENWTTFLKARLNCSIPGNYPFYYNEIQSIHYLEREQLLYATFTTPTNSIYGSAICVFNISAVQRAFNGPFKYQSNPQSTWEKQSNSHKHFQCETPDGTEHFLESEKYQLMFDAVQPSTIHPLYKAELQRFVHIVVDTVSTKNDPIHVMYVSTVEGIIYKFIVTPETQETCIIEELSVLPSDSNETIRVMKLLKDTSSLYIGTEESVLRVPLQRCNRYKTKSECLRIMDPYCGWNENELACTPAPRRNPSSTDWIQDKIKCPKANDPVNGGWSSWSKWFECTQTGKGALGDRCLCQHRICNNPTPTYGGADCEGTSFHVTNCTRNGQWTEWSPWSSCSQSCGLAVKSRRRTCGNPAPAFGGQICVGPERDEIFCSSNPPCPAATVAPIDGQWSEWSTWEECSSPCGEGVQIRRRRCNSPPAQYGGRECHGCSQDYQFCNSNPCPEMRKSSSWTPFLIVNRTKDGYFEQRFRFSCRANVPDERMLRIGNMKKEERFCPDGSRNCLDTAFVNVGGEWSGWSSWSECSASCGGGVQYRERFCDSPRPSGSGADCQGLSRIDRACNVEPCGDVENWDQWSVWSLCDQSQEQHRKRKCKIPVTTDVCKGPTKETRMCINEQINLLASSHARKEEDGIHAAHIVAAFFSGIILGGLMSAFAVYFYLKRKTKETNQFQNVSKQLIPVRPNTYVDESEWKNNFTANMKSSQKIPLREATIKRNGNFRAKIQSDQNF